MKIAIDGTPAATQFAGVGRYTRELMKALLSDQASGDTFEILCSATAEQATSLLDDLPPGLRRDLRRIPVSERVTTAVWQRLHLPVPVDWWLREAEVFHGPDFVLPPSSLPKVVTIHDLSFVIRPDLGEPALVGYLASAVPRSLSQADQIITVSASVAAEVIEAYPTVRDRVRAIPNGVSMPIADRPAPTTRGTQPTVLIVGTIEPRKNHLALLDAMSIVRTEVPDVRLVIAGRIGWQSDQIVRRIRSEMEAHRVELVQSPSDPELESVYRQATVFAYPSFYEGFGLPVLEAMARGIPVVASDIPVLRETSGHAALLADPFEPEHLAHQILRVLNDTILRESLVDAGYERVARYSWTETARRTRLAYAAAIERRTR